MATEPTTETRAVLNAIGAHACEEDAFVDIDDGAGFILYDFATGSKYSTCSSLSYTTVLKSARNGPHTVAVDLAKTPTVPLVVDFDCKTQKAGNACSLCASPSARDAALRAIVDRVCICIKRSVSQPSVRASHGGGGGRDGENAFDTVVCIAETKRDNRRCGVHVYTSFMVTLPAYSCFLSRLSSLVEDENDEHDAFAHFAIDSPFALPLPGSGKSADEAYAPTLAVHIPLHAPDVWHTSTIDATIAARQIVWGDGTPVLDVARYRCVRYKVDRVATHSIAASLTVAVFRCSSANARSRQAPPSRRAWENALDFRSRVRFTNDDECIRVSTTLPVQFALTTLDGIALRALKQIVASGACEAGSACSEAIMEYCRAVHSAHVADQTRTAVSDLASAAVLTAAQELERRVELREPDSTLYDAAHAVATVGQLVDDHVFGSAHAVTLGVPNGFAAITSLLAWPRATFAFAILTVRAVIAAAYSAVLDTYASERLDTTAVMGACVDCVREICNACDDPRSGAFRRALSRLSPEALLVEIYDDVITYREWITYIAWNMRLRQFDPAAWEDTLMQMCRPADTSDSDAEGFVGLVYRYFKANMDNIPWVERDAEVVEEDAMRFVSLFFSACVRTVKLFASSSSKQESYVYDTQQCLYLETDNAKNMIEYVTVKGKALFKAVLHRHSHNAAIAALPQARQQNPRQPKTSARDIKDIINDMWVELLYKQVPKCTFPMNMYPYFINTMYGVFDTVTHSYALGVPFLYFGMAMRYVLVPFRSVPRTLYETPTELIWYINKEIDGEWTRVHAALDMCLSRQRELLLATIVVPGCVDMQRSARPLEQRDATRVIVFAQTFFNHCYTNTTDLLREMALLLPVLRCVKAVDVARLAASGVVSLGEQTSVDEVAAEMARISQRASAAVDTPSPPVGVFLGDAVVTDNDKDDIAKCIDVMTWASVLEVDAKLLCVSAIALCAYDRTRVARTIGTSATASSCHTSLSTRFSDAMRTMLGDVLVPDNVLVALAYISTIAGFDTQKLRALLTYVCDIFNVMEQRKYTVGFIGRAKSGKSTLLNILAAMYPQNAVTNVPVMVGHEEGASPLAMRMTAAFLNIIRECKGIHSSVITTTSGADPTDRRGLFRDFKRRNAVAHLFFAGNGLPFVSGFDGGVAERLRIHRCQYRFHAQFDSNVFVNFLHKTYTEEPDTRPSTLAKPLAFIAFVYKKKNFGNGSVVSATLEWTRTQCARDLETIDISSSRVKMILDYAGLVVDKTAADADGECDDGAGMPLATMKRLIFDADPRTHMHGFERGLLGIAYRYKDGTFAVKRKQPDTCGTADESAHNAKRNNHARFT